MLNGVASVESASFSIHLDVDNCVLSKELFLGSFFWVVFFFVQILTGV